MRAISQGSSAASRRVEPPAGQQGQDQRQSKDQHAQAQGIASRSRQEPRHVPGRGSTASKSTSSPERNIR